MGSIMSIVECPQCNKNCCHEDFNYRSGEIYTSCPVCGYHYHFEWQRDGDGKLIKDTSGECVADEKEQFAYCAFNVRYNQFGEQGYIVDKEDYKDFKYWVRDMPSIDRANIVSISTSRVVNGRVYKKTLYQQGITKATRLAECGSVSSVSEIEILK